MNLLTTCDGSNELLIFTVAICETESAPAYEWFAETCVRQVLQGTSTKIATVIFSDRLKGIESFHDVFREFVGHCFFHIIKTAGTISEEVIKPSRTKRLGYFRKLRPRRNTGSI